MGVEPSQRVSDLVSGQDLYFLSLQRRSLDHRCDVAFDMACGRQQPTGWIWGFAAVALSAAITIAGLAVLKARPAGRQ